MGSAPRRRSDYGLRGELNLALERYRRAANAEERSAPLMQLALSDRPEVFPFLMDELRRGQAEDRPAVVEALIQYGNREAIPALRELAEASPDPDERRSLGEAADYLALPSYAEVYLRKTKPAAVVETP